MNMRRTLGMISSSVVLFATIMMSMPIHSHSFLDVVGNTTCDPYDFNKSMFPKDFIFGAGSSSYQFEGAYNIDGKGQSVWDTFTHEHPDKILDHSTGDVAADQYHRYKEDIALMKELGMEAYRFSISWSRILPNGKISGGVNEKGLEYYNNLTNEIIAHGMKPFVTIFHYDLPQHLQFEYGGFLSRYIVPDFQEYAELLFETLGDRVKHWITLNEPYSLSYYAYNLGASAPGRCSKFMGNCSYGDSGTEPYIVAHNQLLAHAAAVDVYRKKYKVKQKGTIGITLVCAWMEPYSCSDNDKKAHLRALDFMLGWFMDPIIMGDYPASMRENVGNRLPIFSEKEKKMVKGSIDFLGLNYYTGKYVSDAKTVDPPSYSTDIGIKISTERDGIPIGERTDIAEFFIYPQGFKNVLLYVKEHYHNPIIYITENGFGDKDNKSLSQKEALRDPKRIKYFCSHLQYLRDSIKKGVDVRGYFAWALLDNFEWPSGYTDRFGILYVDFNNNVQRYKKMSAIWFQNFLRPNN